MKKIKRTKPTRADVIHKRILKVTKGTKFFLTAQEIMLLMGTNDPNKVRPSLTAMCQPIDGRMRKAGKMHCPVSNRVTTAYLTRP